MVKILRNWELGKHIPQFAHIIVGISKDSVEFHDWLALNSRNRTVPNFSLSSFTKFIGPFDIKTIHLGASTCIEYLNL